MMEEPARRVKILRETVARKIAAGEVIDRPASLLRELVDNALDAGSFSIDVGILQGGIQEIRVKDDGWGMTSEDLELCTLPHATSKIETVEDLDRARTLGFRGEALAAAAACTRLSILTSQDDSGAGHALEAQEGQLKIQRSAAKKGTLVVAKDLFHSIPARRHFLKSSGAETLVCRKTLEDKALAHPGISFRFSVDGQLKFALIPSTPLQRVSQIAGLDPTQLRWFAKEFPGGKVEGVLGLPPLSRTDRKDIHIFVNRRKVTEASLTAAVISGFDEVLAGGLFPLAWIFFEIDPSLTDFNIHPAKREVRFRGQLPLFQTLSRAIKDSLLDLKIQAPQGAAQEFSLPMFSEPEPGSSDSGKTGFWSQNPGVLEPKVSGNFLEAYQQALKTAVLPPSTFGEKTYSFRYLGQALNLFLIAEKDDQLFLVDQHAAHERIIFEQLRQRSQEVTPLLIPRLLGEDCWESVEKHREVLKALGVWIERDREGVFLTGIPTAAGHLEAEVAEFLENYAGIEFDLEKTLYARLACRAAVMDGHILDPKAAMEIIDGALKLDNARCPHGRPIWRIFSRKELYQIFERLVK